MINALKWVFTLRIRRRVRGSSWSSIFSSNSAVLKTAFLDRLVVIPRVDISWLPDLVVFVEVLERGRHLLHCVFDPWCCLGLASVLLRTLLWEPHLCNPRTPLSRALRTPWLRCHCAIVPSINSNGKSSSQRNPHDCWRFQGG